MLKLNPKPKQTERESTIALINIVFLMLIFFLIAGTITPPIDSQVEPISASNENDADLNDMLAIRADGELVYKSESIEVDSYASTFLANEANNTRPVKLFVDQKLEATKLVTVINTLKASGIISIQVITKKKAN